MNVVFRHVRAICRATALISVTSSFYLVWLLFNPFFLVSKKASYAWRNLNFRGWARLTAWLLGMKISVKGTQPQAPFLLVSNHLSYLDIVAFATQVDCVHVAKSEVANWPFLGRLCRSMGTIFIDRGSKKDVLRVNFLVSKVLAERKGVLLFPEGTSSPGDEVLPFHSALLEPAVSTAYPVSYAVVEYETHPDQSPARLSVCWWGEMSLLPHLYRLFQLTTFEARLTFGSHSICADERKALARSLRQTIRDELNVFITKEDQCQTITR